MDKTFVVVFPEIGRGGAERFVSYLVNFLITRGYKIVIISLGPVHDYAFLSFPPEAKVYHFTRNSKFDFSAFTKIEELLSTLNYNFIFCIDFFAQMYMALFRLRRKLNFKIVVNLHITIPKKYKDYLINFIAARLLKKTDWVIFISKNQLEYVTARFLFGTTQNTRVIYNGIDTATYTMVDADTKANLRRQLLDLPDAAKIFIKVAGIRIEKDHETAIKALKFYHESYTDKPYLVILGDGDNKLLQQLHAQAAELDIANYVRFIGFTADVNQYLSSCDVFTLTSHSVETFSLAALEAMACGLPVVLTNIGGANEMVDDKINGTLSLPHNPENIAFNWFKVSNMKYNKQAIREFTVSKFDVAIMNNNYLDFIKQLA